MAAPSLGELTNFRVDPEIAGPLQPIIDNTETVRLLNDSAKFQAEAAWKKHNEFQKNLSNVFENLDEDAKLPIMDKDREMLQKKAADILGKIGSDPKKAMSGEGFVDVNKDLLKLRQDTFLSGKHNLFNNSMREYMAKNPETNTDDNKALISKYEDTPLYERKAYNLDLPPIFDSTAYRTGVEKLSSKSYKTDAKYTGVGNQFEFYPNAKATNHDDYMKRWMGGYNTFAHQIEGKGSKQRIEPIKKAVKYQYDQLPEVAKEAYEKKAKDSKDFGGDPVAAFFYEQGEAEFNSLGTPDNKGNIIDLGKSTYRGDALMLEKEKFKDKQALLKQKFGYDESLIKERGGVQAGLAELRHNLKKADETERNEVIDGITTDALVDARNNPIGKLPLGEQYGDQYRIDISPEIASAFGETETSTDINGKPTSVKITPSMLTTNEDGSKITAVYKKADGTIDQSKTKQFDANVFRQGLGVALIGKGGLSKNLGSGHIHTAPTKGTQQPSTKQSERQYNVSGQKYTHTELIKAGWTEAQIKKYEKG